ncbi:hypothetical protein K488DRAFT_80972 [Vararia minispora EC-137]|uniref:Uncharacterized protein n=1 Tax=Vararia minispora EC-137 TaxID=1314806 RepID=A0ACB8Q7K1_9AGAM|nr:hypothetical protein K488DRAFT_80972 [Vararia minispora EC-137]
MAVLSLPLSFTNSFWSQDYRRGLEVLFTKLHQARSALRAPFSGAVENDEIVAFIKARAGAEANLAAALTQTTGPGPPSGFAADDGATLLAAFRGLQAETAKQAEVHRNIAHELDTLVAQPFAEWAKGHKDRLNSTENALTEGQLRAYENAVAEVAKLKNQYLDKVRKADEAEDDAKFAPSNEINGDKFTTSPRLQPVGATTTDSRSAPQRTATVSERIAARLWEIQKKTAAATGASSSSVGTQAPEKDALLDEPTKVDKGKARATDEPPQAISPLSMSPLARTKELEPSAFLLSPPQPPMLLAGLSLPPAGVSNLLMRAREQLPLRPVRLPILGEYQDCFTGDEFAAWLRDNVAGLGGSFDRAEEAARDLTERDGLLRRIGELRNLFEPSDEAFYQFRPKAFELGKVAPPARQETDSMPSSPSILKRGNNFLSAVSHALVQDREPRHVRARQEADEADRAYRVGVRKLDRQRLVLEQRIEEALKMLQKLETERLRAVKTCLLQYRGTLSNMPRALESSISERSAAHIAAFVPDADLVGLMERYRTGPFRPHAHIYESVAHDEADVLFGLDLRRWADGGWGVLVGSEEKKEHVPPVLEALLGALDKAYPTLPSDDERRKAWVYEVPLRAIHHAREALNGVGPDQPIPYDMLAKYDAPVLASTIKLWLLELDPPLALWEGWDDIRKIYPSVGSGKIEHQNEQEHLQVLRTALQRWPKVHLYVLDALISHIRKVIESTTAEEPNEVYITKLALSFGRTILRPRQETVVSLQDRHPAAFFIDLINFYKDLIPSTIEKKKKEVERKMPIRKRTAPIDLRMSRSRLSAGTEARDWLASQRAAGKIPPPVPKLVTPVPPGQVSTDVSTLAVAMPSTAGPDPPPPAGPGVEKPMPPVTTSSTLSQDPDQPPRPSFKEPPPENEDLPPRPPMFKEPDLDDTPVLHSIVTKPVPEFSLKPASGSEEQPDPSMFASPKTPSPKPTSRAGSPRLVVRPLSPPRSSSPLKADDDKLSTSTSLKRTSFVRGAGALNESRLRGPRGSRPPRTSGASVSQPTANLNKRESESPGPGKRASKPVSGISENKRTSLTGRASLSSRTMESDAEDNLVG